MNKKQLVDAICKETKAKSKKDVTAVVECALTLIKKAVKKGDSVTLIGFGTFSRSARKARKGVNPSTGAPLKIKATKVAKFKPGVAFKDLVAGKKPAKK